MSVSVVTKKKRKSRKGAPFFWRILIRFDQNGKLASSGSANCPDADVVQSAYRTDLSYLFCHIFGTWKPCILPDVKSNHEGKRNRKACRWECRFEKSEEAKARL